MKITLAAVGKLKPGPEKTLFSDYTKRLPWKLEVHEIITHHGKEVEGAALLKAVGGCHKLIVLDERGKSLASPALAEQIKAWQNEGHSHLGFIIGGADGLSDAVRKSAHLLLSFGALTWPHLLVRALLAEQLYRAHTLLTGHPYHRE